jgi:hypothetical protein
MWCGKGWHFFKIAFIFFETTNFLSLEISNQEFDYG